MGHQSKHVSRNQMVQTKTMINNPANTSLCNPDSSKTNKYSL